MKSKSTWKALIINEMADQKENWGDVVQHTLSDDELTEEFDCGYGGEEGCGFTLWTKKRVYFPACYDGAEWVASVPRAPSGEKTWHVGG